MKEQDGRTKQAVVKVERQDLLFLNLSLPIKPAIIFGLMLGGWLGTQLVSLSDKQAWAESATSQPPGKLKGNVMRGRDIFNGKGVCYYCHGIDGYLARKPRLEKDTAALIARLNPPPTDLRDPVGLRLKSNKERSRAIREGHPGTGMFPDTTMTDQDLADTLIYLALIRQDPNPTEE
jgi:hypothetical protein